MTLAAALAGDTYYVDATNGNDINSGTSIDASWKTIAKVNSFYFNPGETILFKRGEVWREELRVSSSGENDRTITFGAYGNGDKPCIRGTLKIAPNRNAVRNSSFEDFTGIIDDNIADTFSHFTVSGGLTEAVSDTPAGKDNIALKLKHVGIKANLSFYVYLPANTEINLSYWAKSVTHDGDIAMRYWDNGSTCYLQDDLFTWDTTENWSCYKLAGAVDNVWRQRNFIFTTGNFSGLYQIYFSSGNYVDNDISYLYAPSIIFNWEQYSGAIYKIGTGYNPRRIILKTGEEWVPLLNAADTGHTKDTLNNQEWVYDNGFVYFRDDTGNPDSSDILLEMSFPETNECGILINGKEYITIDELAIIGWPGYNPIHLYTGGIAVTNAKGIKVTDCLISGNYMCGLHALNSSNLVFSDNIAAYNGGNGITLVSNSYGCLVARNIAEYNGYWGDDSADGEGVAGGAGSYDNIYENNIIHHNNVNTEGNSVAFVLWNSDNNIVRYNQIYSNYHGGAAVYGNNNQFYYNLVYNNGIGYAQTDFYALYNLSVGDNTENPQGGSKIYNNIFYGGRADTSWIADLFISDQCTDSEFRNNIFWGFDHIGSEDRQIWFDGDEILTNTVFSNNIIGPESPAFIHWVDGKNYSSLLNYKNISGQEIDSFSLDPLFINPNEDFHLKADSPAINKGIDAGLTADFKGNIVPFGIAPDIGAFEYNPVIKGDIDTDGDVDVLDLQLCVNYVLSGEYNKNADVDADGKVNVIDVQELVNLILKGG